MITKACKFIVGSFGFMMVLTLLVVMANVGFTANQPLVLEPLPNHPVSAGAPDDHCTGMERGAYAYAKPFIEANLRVPGSAQYPHIDSVHIQWTEGCVYKYTSYVEAENAFGGTSRQGYAISVKPIPGVSWLSPKWELVSFAWL